MAKALGRKKPFSGELIRLYENHKNRPRGQARKALALVFGKSEEYIEFGDATKNRLEQGQAHYETEPTAREQILLILFRGLLQDQQKRLIQGLRALHDANNITRKELGATTLRGVSDELVRKHFGDVPKPTVPKPQQKPRARDPGDAMGDFLDP